MTEALEEVPVRRRVPKTAGGLHSPRWWSCLALLIAGIFLLLDVAIREDRWMDSQAWSRAIVLRTNDAGYGGIPVWMRAVPAEGEESSGSLSGQDATRLKEYEAQKADVTGWVASVDCSTAAFEPLLDSGFLPHPGMPELLAGHLATSETVVLDGVVFRVVGRLRPSVASFSVSYLIPSNHALSNHFQAHPAVVPGYLLPKGPAGRRGDDPDSILLWSPAQTRTRYTAEIWLGLLLVAWGGAKLYRRVFLSIRPWAPRLLQPLLAEIARRRHEWVASHLMLYGLFFGAMIAACLEPKLAYTMKAMMIREFSDGHLDYIGAAYNSHNIWRASLATFYNNYVVQTLLLAFGTSLVVLPLGALKTAITFMMVGLGMAPLWTLQASLYWYHAITLVLELEAYVLAVFIIIRWSTFQMRALLTTPRAFLRAVIGRTEAEGPSRFLRRRLKWNSRVFFGAILITALMLAIAALYEAATLIVIA